MVQFQIKKLQICFLLILCFIAKNVFAGPIDVPDTIRVLLTRAPNLLQTSLTNFKNTYPQSVTELSTSPEILQMPFDLYSLGPRKI